jgi:hypothetical protein
MKILITVPIQPEFDFLLQAWAEKSFHTRNSMIGRLPLKAQKEGWARFSKAWRHHPRENPLCDSKVGGRCLTCPECDGTCQPSSGGV